MSHNLDGRGEKGGWTEKQMGGSLGGKGKIFSEQDFGGLKSRHDGRG